MQSFLYTYQYLYNILMTDEESQETEQNSGLDTRLSKLQELLLEIEEEHNLTPAKALSLLEKRKKKGLSIPLSVFSERILGPLEAVVKHLKESEALTYVEIGSILGRNPAVIGVVYRNARKKDVSTARHLKSGWDIPVTALSGSKLTILESVVRHLKEDKRLNYSKIGALLKRDQRTIWTVYQNAFRKTIKNINNLQEGR